MLAQHNSPFTRRVVGAGAWAAAVLLLTSIHHAWGAVMFETPWRLEILHLVVPSAVVILGALWLGWRTRQHTPARFLFWIATFVILCIPVALIGVLEGGYNHLVKNAVYFTLGEQQAWRLFPAQFYAAGEVEMPSDMVFELTGIAQFPLGILAGMAAFKLLRTVHRPERSMQTPLVTKHMGRL